MRTPQRVLGLLAAISIGTSACAPEDEDSPYVDAASGIVTPSVEAGVRADAAVQPQLDGGSAASREAGLPESSTGMVGSTLDAQGGGGGERDADAAEAPVDAQSPRDAAPDAASGDAGGGSATTTPSAGCGKGQRPTNGRVSVTGDHNYTFPAAYDGKRPFPLLIGFHAASNPIEQIENLTKGSELEQSYVRAFPKSQGTAWDYGTDIAKVRAMFDDLLANYCIDTSRVFATGHSSGAQLIVQILTPAHKSDADRFRFRAVAPVAASRYGTVSRAIPVLYIQGAHDNVRNSDGADVVKEFVTANGCMQTTKPYTGPACMSSGKTVSDGCRQYDGCSVPTIWCSHDDPQYSSTNHGWPCFATKAMASFFASLP